MFFSQVKVMLLMVWQRNKIVLKLAKKATARKDWVTIATTGQLERSLGKILSSTAKAKMDILQLSQAWKFTTS